MKKLIMLAAVLLGTTAASQAGLDIHLGIPLPPLPRIVVSHPAPRYCPPPVVVTPPCPPVYGYVHRYPRGYSHGYHHHGNHWGHGHHRDGHHHHRRSHGHHGRH